MTITLLQQDIVWGNIQANHDKAHEAILAAPKSDLYVLPEMWSTGFATSPAEIAEDDQQSLSWMKAMANQLNAAIAGSVATKVGNSFFNRFYFVKPKQNNGSNEVCFYDKHHLFLGEKSNYRAGNNRVIVSWRGVRFLLQVCYDLRFPIFARNAESCDTDAYDVALYPASWPSVRREPWDILLKARAIENQCYVCGINRVGNDPSCNYNGGTVIIDAYGRTVAACEDNKECWISAEINLDKLEAFRTKFPVLKDRDK